MTELYFVRHGQTENNLNKLMNGGSVDSPLTDKGIRGAQAVGAFLEATTFDHVFVSPQRRAQTTAKLIMRGNDRPDVPTTILEGLREFDMGAWDGLPFADLPQNQLFDDYMNHPERYDASQTGGESYMQLITRGQQAIKQITTTVPLGKVLVVSHGVLLRTTLNTLRGYPLAQVRTGEPLVNCSVTTFAAQLDQQGEPVYQCLSWDQHDFLD
ncbi:histidine phosphatase family protein [Lapidilactobacillus luobeiensis]|uniref:histidine phosphatase family protein n=1 Tax=Lapidilactobacillus luobeiensis TaxID=2950371 RepID=UPI0021C41C63|nr:histidine phosphatase family protein [Lapidilactobacillus luobeiensis]